MCGLPGAGKTTYATELARRGYVRLSIDEAVWQRCPHYKSLSGETFRSENAGSRAAERCRQRVKRGPRTK
ncbi:AAA family ATPase [Kitasatospora aureofaciens]|uniref:AAA family ATPase n=1 Tax=Kitasatospora aureofaciens TaxID=1894 RepID=UPI0037C6A6F7